MLFTNKLQQSHIRYKKQYNQLILIHEDIQDLIDENEGEENRTIIRKKRKLWQKQVNLILEYAPHYLLIVGLTGEFDAFTRVLKSQSAPLFYPGDNDRGRIMASVTHGSISNLRILATIIEEMPKEKLLEAVLMINKIKPKKDFDANIATFVDIANKIRNINLGNAHKFTESMQGLADEFFNKNPDLYTEYNNRLFGVVIEDTKETAGDIKTRKIQRWIHKQILAKQQASDPKSKIDPFNHNSFGLNPNNDPKNGHNLQ